MESSYQTISKISSISTIAQIISPSKPSPSYLNTPPVVHSTVSFNSSTSSLPHHHYQKNSNALSINLSRKNLTAEQLIHLSNNFPLQSNIATLKLGFNDLQDAGAVVISSLLEKNRSITLLDLGFTHIGDSGIEAISLALGYNQTLKVLYLSGNLLTAVGFKSLGHALSSNKSLQALYLTGNNGQADGAKYIAKGLKYNNSLEKLFLNGNKIESDGCSTISDTLLTNHSIVCLNLSDNNIDDSGLLSLSEAMANHRNIQELELSFNKISSLGMQPFIDSLIGYNTLQRLLIDNNKLGDGGAKALSLALPHMRLAELNVGFNEIGIEGLLSIVGGVTNSKSLSVLTLSGNTVDDSVAKALANMLMINTSLQAIYIDRTNLSSLGERFIATGIASNRFSALRKLTGFNLGKVLHLLGSPAVVCDMSNELALKYLYQMWKNVRMQQENKRASSSDHQALNDPQLINNVRKMKDLPHSHGDYWSLHQYYYSPPFRSMSNDLENSAPTPKPDLRSSEDLCHDRPETGSRPTKRPVNKNTVTRINNYPGIKNLLESFKSEINEEKSLLVMRQLRYLEETVKADYPEIEKLFFDQIFER